MTKKILQISKYHHDNPVLQQRYNALAWDDIADVIPPIGNGSVSFIEYWRAETAYVDDILNILRLLDITVLHLSEVGVHSFGRHVAPSSWVEGATVSVADIDPIIRYGIRGLFGCRLFSEAKLFVRFGFDMYVYVGTDIEEEVSIAPSTDLISHRDVSDRVGDVDVFYWGALRPMS